MGDGHKGYGDTSEILTGKGCMLAEQVLQVNPGVYGPPIAICRNHPRPAITKQAARPRVSKLIVSKLIPGHSESLLAS